MPNDAPPSRLTLNGMRKAAILLVLLGEEVASQIYRNLPEHDLEQLTQEIAELEYIDPRTALDRARGISPPDHDPGLPGAGRNRLRRRNCW